MRAFARLFSALDRTPRRSEKVAALADYFRRTPPADAAWALWFLSGQRLKRAVKTTHLRQWVAEAAELPVWLVEECYEHVGDLGETLALLLPPHPRPAPPPLAQLVEQRLLPLAGATAATQRSLLRATWAQLDTPQCFLWHKLITGNFRVGVSRALLVRALAGLAGVEPPVMAHRLLGPWRPTAADFTRLLSGDSPAADPARPYPFHLASPLEGGPRDLGDVADWQIEWKWDGIRAQLLRRAGDVMLWSRGEEILTPGFPEIAGAARALPDGTVLDGEVLAWRGDGPLPFAQLQRRLNRRQAGLALRRAVPVVFMAYDLVESEGRDRRCRSLGERRLELEQTLAAARDAWASRPRPTGEAALLQPELFPDTGARPAPAPDAVAPDEFPLRLSPWLAVTSWDEAAGLHEQSRASGVEGLMLKRRDSAYGAGRQRGAWWKWKVAPFTCDAVLVAAQPGHGRRATLFTDFTFAVWRGAELVPVAKAYSGLTDEEIDAVDAFVRANTTGRFGPVRSVKPELVFELAFEGLAASPRHASGLALRFPRIARWRRDKPVAEADTVETLRALTKTVDEP
jgi:DNA ligase-1